MSCIARNMRIKNSKESKGRTCGKARATLNKRIHFKKSIELGKNKKCIDSARNKAMKHYHKKTWSHFPMQTLT